MKEDLRIPDFSKPFDVELNRAAKRMSKSFDSKSSSDLNQSAIIVLTHIIIKVLTDFGSEKFLHPLALSKKDAVIGSCFMAICLAGISEMLEIQNVKLDIKDVYAKSGLAAFQFYKKVDAANILADGWKLYISVLSESPKRKNIEEWVDGVWAAVAGYVLTNDENYLWVLKKQYLSLWNAREINDTV